MASPETRSLIVAAAASLRLEAAREWLGSWPADAAVLVLAPSRPAADELTRADVAGSGTRFGIERFTLERLAARLAEPGLARTGRAPATPLSLAAVVARAAHELHRDDAFAYFRPVSDRPGFAHAAAHTIDDLRMSAVDRNTLHRQGRGGDALAALLAAVEAELERSGLADRAAVFETARAALEEPAATIPVGLPLIALDLPLGTIREARLLAALAQRSPRVLATAPAGDQVAIERLEEALSCHHQTLELDESAGSLASLQRHLFEESRPEPRPLDDGVRLSSAPGEARECVEIARRIQSEAGRGGRFDSMAVFLRAPFAYRGHLEEALRRAEIPAFFARGTTRPDPAGRALLALLSCAAEGLSARRFAEYLSLAQVPDPGGGGEDAWSPPSSDLLPVTPAETRNGGDFPTVADPRTMDPDAPVLEGTLRAPWRWERLLVDAAVIGGRERWQRRLDGLAAELDLQRTQLAEEDARAAGLARAVRDLDHLRGFALPVIDRLAALPHGAEWGTWLEHLRGLAGAALRHPTHVLAVLAELDPLAPVGPVELSDVQHVLSPRLRDLGVEPEPRTAGAVFVGPIEAARGLSFDVVFVPGLAEKIFPPKIVEDPLLPDEVRRTIGAEGLATQSERVAAERLALRIAAGAARRHLALSWPRIDLEQARPRVPSFYGLEALRAAEGRLPGFDELRRRAESGGRARLGWPAPEHAAEAIDDAEYDLATLAGMDPKDEESSRGAAHYLLAANPRLARALRARARRWIKRWTQADGLVDPDQDALAALARHRMGARSFSPTALENFAACPYRFLLQAIHRLEPREEADALETIDPLTRGALFHEVQFEVLTSLRDEGRLPLDPERLEVAFQRLDQAVERVASAYEERLAPAIPRVWADGVNAIRADLREWLRRSADEAIGWVPHRFELSFGLAGSRRRPTADESSVPDPVSVLDGVLLRGSIDLVERRFEGTLRVTDHKTGKARAPEGAIVGGGQILQPVLYALVAEALLEGPVESGRLYYCTADGDFTERVISLDETSRAHAASAVAVVARALERGFLPAAPVAGACMWCDYRPVCGPNEEFRTATRKPAEGIADLQSLRSLP